MQFFACAAPCYELFCSPGAALSVRLGCLVNSLPATMACRLQLQHCSKWYVSSCSSACCACGFFPSMVTSCCLEGQGRPVGILYCAGGQVWRRHLLQQCLLRLAQMCHRQQHSCGNGWWGSCGSCCLLQCLQLYCAWQQGGLGWLCQKES